MAKKGGSTGSKKEVVLTNAGPNPMGPPAKSQGPAKSVADAGKVLTKSEAASIAKAQDKTVAQVMAKAQDKGVGLGSSLVNQFNKGNLGPNLNSFGTDLGDLRIYAGLNGGTQKALNALAPLQGLQMNKGTVYGGYSTTTRPAYNSVNHVSGSTYTPGSTTYNPIVLPRQSYGGGGAGYGGGGAGGGGNGGGNGGDTKNNGQFENIVALYQEEIDKARAEIDDWRNKSAKQINELTLNFNDQLTASQTAADQEIAGLQDLMAQQQMQSQQTQSLLQDQVTAAQAAYAEQARAASALGRAFVPALEPTAASVQLGDQRRTQRDEVNNSLSSLAITSGLGTNTNPLAGLQLA